MVCQLKFTASFIKRIEYTLWKPKVKLHGMYVKVIILTNVLQLILVDTVRRIGWKNATHLNERRALESIVFITFIISSLI